MRTLWLYALAVLALCLTQVRTASADSWLPPAAKTYTSSSGSVRLTVTPRPLAAALPYFSDKVEGREPAGQRTGAQQVHAMARLEEQVDGRWTRVWEGPLINDVAPVEAVVAGSGRFATLDNWHMMGHGDDAIVLYDRSGTVVRSLGLDDLLPPAWRAVLPTTVSSVHWRGDARIEGDVMLLEVVKPSEHASIDKRVTVPLRLSLETGEPLEEQDQAWTQALQDAAELDAARRERWQALRVERAKPLAPPSGRAYADWRAYMEELRTRLNMHKGLRHSGVVLPTDGGGHFPDSADGVTSALDMVEVDLEYGAVDLLFVSPSSNALVTLLQQHMNTLGAGALKGASITFVGSSGHLETLRAVAARTGAELRLIDMGVPYPGVELPTEVPDEFIGEPGASQLDDAESADNRSALTARATWSLLGIGGLSAGIAWRVRNRRRATA